MSSLLTANQISLTIGQKTILNQVSFDLEAGQIVAVVGRNGSGKSSLLKLIAGLNQLDEGSIQFRNDLSIGYLAQESDLDENLTVQAVLEMALAKAFKDQSVSNSNAVNSSLSLVNEIIYSNDQNWLPDQDKLSESYLSDEQKLWEKISSGWQNQLQQLVSELSGGQKRKLALAQVLISQPDLLILDEPTNHLDIEAIETLEKTLQEYVKSGQRSILLVSHDRFFLDKLATRMLEIWDSAIYNHFGNYQNYLHNKKVRLEIATITDQRHQDWLKQELNWVRAGVKARSTKDKGRLERYEIAKNQKPVAQNSQIEILLPPGQPLGNKIINLEGVNLEMGGQKIVQNLNFDFTKDTVLGLIGPNGSGKTSLIKAILGQIKAQSGQIVVGQNTIFNYQDQQKWNLNLENTVFAEIADNQETFHFGNTIISSRPYLRKLGFDSQQILTPIKHLSGGQRARLILAKILNQGGNCLILDEPTNDLDLETIELLEESIVKFEGVCLIVSHDRYFLNRVCNHILSLEGHGNFTLSTGNFDDFAAKKAHLEINPGYFVTPAKIQKTDYKQQKQQQKDLQKCESQITKLESTIKDLETEFEKPDFYVLEPVKYQKLSQKLEVSKQELANLLEKWESLSQTI